ncbi:MAG: 2-isopropylmalate synthase [Candidatus Binatota bacterium]|nr:2-isopropylmalate synthase [Candidatus Binatota bacterium]
MTGVRRIRIYDTTLRDGCQGEDVSLTLADKLRIAERLDDLGFDYVEGGWPGSNPRDEEFFREARKLRLRHARIAAFGMTRRANAAAANDLNLRKLVESETPVITIFGKTWDLHVTEDLAITLEQNLEVIRDSVEFLKRHASEVVFDAEHFFDGYRANPTFALDCLRAAADGGADVVVLCDTNGGNLPSLIAGATREAAGAVSKPLGIHCHNDCDLAVANSLAAIEAGAVHVQGTINGVGERCGNANLISIIADLELKMGQRTIGADAVRRLTELAHFVDELANLTPRKNQPYVGQSAFAHKGGVHVAAVRKNRLTYEHVDPESVGNSQRVLISDLAGRGNVLHKAEEFGLRLDSKDPKVQAVLTELKELENAGYQYEGAEASFELLMKRALGEELRFYRLIGFRVIDEKRTASEPPLSEATIMIESPDGRIEHTAATGTGPVHALDRALRKALTKFYPEIAHVRLLDYKVRVLAGMDGTGAKVRVLVESGDDDDRWGTVGVSQNVIEASWQALVDSIDFKLYKDRRRAEEREAAARQG